MAKFSIATNDPLTVKKWSEVLYREALKESYFEKFMSEGNDNIVHTIRDLEKKPGDLIKIPLRMKISGPGVGPGETLEGKEEELKFFDFEMTLTERRNAVRISGIQFTEKRPAFAVTPEAEMALKDWMSEYLDKVCFDKIGTNPTKSYFGFDKANLTVLLATDLLTPTIISKIKTWAETGGNRSQNPIRPIRIKGNSYYVYLMHPDCGFDLKRNPEYLTNLREALERSPDNPIFTGALGVSHDGVVFHTHENIKIGLDAGAGGNVPYSQNLFLGAEALCWAWGMRPDFTNEEFDYGYEFGVAAHVIYGCEKTKFQGKDFGAIASYVARTSISDA